MTFFESLFQASYCWGQRKFSGLEKKALCDMGTYESAALVTLLPEKVKHIIMKLFFEMILILINGGEYRDRA